MPNCRRSTTPARPSAPSTSVGRGRDFFRRREAQPAQRRRPRAVRDRDAAAQCDGGSAHGARPQQHRSGCDHPLAAHVRRRSALGSRHRPRRDRDPEHHREAARRRRQDAIRPRPRSVRRADDRVRRGDRRDDSPASCARSARRATGPEPPTRFRPSCRARCAKRSSSCTSAASSIAAIASSTGAPRCLTSLSDEEAEHSEEMGKLYHVALSHCRREGPMRALSSRPRVPKRCSATSRSRCIPTTSATGSSSESS